jgi:hypothetical protein
MAVKSNVASGVADCKRNALLKYVVARAKISFLRRRKIINVVFCIISGKTASRQTQKLLQLYCLRATAPASRDTICFIHFAAHYLNCVIFFENNMESRNGILKARKAK